MSGTDHAQDLESIRSLVHRYSRLVDGGDVDGLGDLFAHGAFIVPATDTHAVGRDAAMRVFARSLRYHEDGTPQTMHLVGNLDVRLEPGADTATAHSYTSVFQGTARLPLQVILTATYDDRFARVDGRWWFHERIVTFVHQGETREHFVHDLGGFRIPRPGGATETS